MKKFLILIVLLACVGVYAQTENTAALKELNENLVENYKAKNYDEALKIAVRLIEINKAIYSLNSDEAAIAYINAGSIQRERKRFDLAVVNFKTAIDIYENTQKTSSENLIELYQKYALALFSDEKKDEAFSVYRKTIELAELKLGKDAKIGIKPVTELAILLALEKKFDDSDAMFVRLIQLASINFGKESVEIEEIYKTRANYIKSTLDKESVERDRKFGESISKLLGIETILNSRALKLYKPSYPPAAKLLNIWGEVKVEVEVNEKGDVIFAKAVSGHTAFHQVCEKAALKSKFQPTLVNGQPISTKGIIVYFIQRPSFVTVTPRY
jgi:tetratricopeptide (TPR) repeat protein